MNKFKKALQTVYSVYQYPHIAWDLKNSTTSVFLFFPTYEIGGAERVHIDIMEAIKSLEPICFITSIPLNNGFKNEFENASRLIELRRWGNKKVFVGKMASLIAKNINRKKNPVVFGSNSTFFYDLIPYLDNKVKIIDLTHAFSEPLLAPERYSIPYIPRIDKRIVLGNKTLNNYKNLYQKNAIDSIYLNRFKIITNQVKPADNFEKKKWKRSPLKIVFIARNSQEKRPALLFDIVTRCMELKLAVNFIIIGNFSAYQDPHKEYATFTGEITNQHKISEIYQNAHLILITSSSEGFPMVLLESMRYGVVPISTNVGEIPDFISEEKQTGFLINNDQSDAELLQNFVDRISMCIENRDQLEKYAKNNVEMVKKDFSTKKFKNAYLELFS